MQVNAHVLYTRGFAFLLFLSFFLSLSLGAVHLIFIMMHYHKLVTSVSLWLDNLACESDASQFHKLKIIRPIRSGFEMSDAQMLNVPRFTVRHVVTQPALLTRGNYSVLWVIF